VRQLNGYGFKKRKVPRPSKGEKGEGKPRVAEYQHRNQRFRRGKSHLLHEICREPASAANPSNASVEPYSEAGYIAPEVQRRLEALEQDNKSLRAEVEQLKVGLGVLMPALLMAHSKLNGMLAGEVAAPGPSAASVANQPGSGQFSVAPELSSFVGHPHGMHPSHNDPAATAPRTGSGSVAPQPDPSSQLPPRTGSLEFVPLPQRSGWPGT